MAIGSYDFLRDHPAVASTGSSRRCFKATLLNSLGRLTQPTSFLLLSLRRVLAYRKGTGARRNYGTSSLSLFRETQNVAGAAELGHVDSKDGAQCGSRKKLGLNRKAGNLLCSRF
jgi:hypothetical protein